MQFQVTEQAAGVRLDLFLKEKVAPHTRKAAKRLLDAGRIRVNGRKTVIASWSLQRGDLVSVTESSDLEVDLKQFYLKVVYEDDALIVVEKDAGIPCETSPLDLKPSLVQIINEYLRKQSPKPTHPYLGLIHRLDKETSGLMIYSKKPAANRISRQFKEHSINRRYQAVVHGQIEKEQGVVATFIEKVEQAGGLKVRVVTRKQVGPQAKKAETQYRVLERYQNATLIEVIPKTGRTHQIRVHLAHLGHPIVGDKIYGLPRAKEKLRMKRQALHAAVLGFVHPISGKKLAFRSELPRDMRHLVDRLRVQ